MSAHTILQPMKAHVTRVTDHWDFKGNLRDIADLDDILALLKEVEPSPVILRLRDDGDLDAEIYDDYRE